MRTKERIRRLRLSTQARLPDGGFLIWMGRYNYGIAAYRHSRAPDYIPAREILDEPQERMTGAGAALARMTCHSRRR